MRNYRSDTSNEDWMEEPATQIGRTNWWLRLTSKGWDEAGQTIQMRELTRRSQFAAWIILGLFILDALLIGTNLSDSTTVLAGIVAAIGFLIVAMINRAGLVTLAGVVLVLLTVGAIMGSVIFQGADPINHTPAGQLQFAYLPSYDLLAATTVVAAAILPRWALFVTMGLNIGLILADFFLQPQSASLHAYVAGGGAPILLLDPVMLQILLALIAYLWVRGTDNAIRRADRAEELATMEHQLVEQKRQIDLGIQQILQTHIRAANGDFSARAPLGQDNVLFQIASSLNNLLNRLSRSAQAQFQLQRTIQEIGRLHDSLQAARAGRPPLWPMPSGTPVDQLISDIVGPNPGANMVGGNPAAPYLPPAGLGGPSGPLGGGAAARLRGTGAIGSGPMGDGGPGFGAPPAWNPNAAPPAAFGQPAPFGQPPYPPMPATGGLGPEAMPDPFAPGPGGNLSGTPMGAPMPASPFGGASGDPFGPRMPADPPVRSGQEPVAPSPRPTDQWDMPDIPGPGELPS